MSLPPPTPRTLVVDPVHAGLRLDRFLAESLPDTSRALIQKHIDAGCVTIDGAPPRSGSKTPVHASSRVRYAPPPPQPVELLPEDIPIGILYEDAELVVVDKPAGLVVHPALGHASGTLVNALLGRLRDLGGVGGIGDLGGIGGIGGAVRPGIVHRLDRDTSGVMVVAKHDRAHRALAGQFQTRSVSKAYLAITRGIPSPPSATIDTWYGRHPRDRKRFSSRVASGKRAITRYRVTERFLRTAGPVAVLDVEIATGRTHQIRVHLAERGWPLVGDRMYGRGPGPVPFPRPALHARRLAFLHPITGEPLAFEAPIPSDLADLLALLRSGG